MSTQITTFLAIYNFYAFLRNFLLYLQIQSVEVLKNNTIVTSSGSDSNVKKKFLFPNVTRLIYFRPIIDTANANLKSFKL